MHWDIRHIVAVDLDVKKRSTEISDIFVAVDPDVERLKMSSLVIFVYSEDLLNIYIGN